MKNIINIIGDIAEVLINYKKNNKTTPVNQETEDLGYAVVVDDEKNEV